MKRFSFVLVFLCLAGSVFADESDPLFGLEVRHETGLNQHRVILHAPNIPLDRYYRAEESLDLVTWTVIGGATWPPRSPTERGVIIVGGWIRNDQTRYFRLQFVGSRTAEPELFEFWRHVPLWSSP